MTNTAPVIQSVTPTVPAGRLEPNTDVDVAAVVQDLETLPVNLTYNWTANVGTFTGTGASVKWRLPSGLITVPTTVVIKLEVVERYANYDAKGQAITSENRVTKDAQSFVVHDSVGEISAITVRFLRDLFGNSSVSPEACLVDFWDGCGGKNAELGDIKVNRQLFVILTAEASVESVTFKTQNSAGVVAFCRWRDRVIANGAEGVSQGPCLLTAVYENNRWWLCDSSVDHGLFTRNCTDGTNSCIPPAPTGFSLKRYL